MTLPDFLIIGAMKCGTTTLAAQLAAQPGFFMTTPKEPNFFSDDDIHAKGEDWYRGLFAEAAPDDLKGEASTHYTKLPTYPETISRMAALLDAPKLVYIIRNPVERAVSHYIHEWSQGIMGHDPLEAFAQHPELVAYGRYGMQVAPFIERFGPGAVLLTSLEQLKSDPQQEFDRIGAFLGAPRPLVWKTDLGAQNVSSERMRRFPMQGLLIDNPVARTLRRTLVPKSVRTRIRQARTIRERPELPKEQVRQLEMEFAADHKKLAAFFPGNPALTACYPFLK